MKKGKKILKYLTLALLTFTCGFVASSCGFLSSEIEEVSWGIESVYVVQNDDGTQTLTITYLDEDKEDDVFIIPTGGEAGQDGISIVSVTSTQVSAYENLVTIYLANSSTPYVTFTIPAGASIISIEIIKRDESSTNGYVVIYLSDGTYRYLDVYYSSKGEDGDGITGMSYLYENGEIIGIVIMYSTGDTTYIPVADVSGEDGDSITSIVSYQEDGFYHLLIYYDNGDDPNDVSFPIPGDAYTWYNGVGHPDEELGVVGDHYFDIKNLVIYDKILDDTGKEVWEEVLNILTYYKPNENSVKIAFNLNDWPTEPASMPSVYDYATTKDGKYYYYVSVPYNTYYTETHAIPIPTRSGFVSGSTDTYSYEFKGWCTSPEVSPVSGYLTDLTALQDDLTFYALWE